MNICVYEITHRISEMLELSFSMEFTGKIGAQRKRFLVKDLMDLATN
jgi:hypothetical protein